jgi:hypothetical protein
MTKDGGELGRGLRRNAAAMNGSLNHLWDKYNLLKGHPEELSRPLEGMPSEIEADLIELRDAITEILTGGNRISN